jgi:hypothetical protein
MDRLKILSRTGRHFLSCLDYTQAWAFCHRVKYGFASCGKGPGPVSLSTRFRLLKTERIT